MALQDMKQGKLRVALIFGGVSSEHEISCISAKTVAEALDSEKYEVTRIFISKTGQWKLADEVRDYTDQETKCMPKAVLLPSREEENLLLVSENHTSFQHIDLAFPVLHGLGGEDGTIQGVFEMAGIPYVGCGVLASSVCMDKMTTKKIVEPLGIRQARYVCVFRHELDQMEMLCDRVEESLSYPVFVKPSNAGSSVGVTQAKNREELKDSILIAAREDARILVEETIIGHEVECAVLGNHEIAATRVGEILAADTFYTYEAKYNNPDSETVIADYLPEETIGEIRQSACRIFEAVDGRGLSRVDFFIEKSTGEVVFNEINTFPGFTSISMYPMLWANEGLTVDELVDHLIELGFKRDASC